MNRRAFMAVGLAVVAALPFIKLDKTKRIEGQNEPRIINDKPPFGFQPPHQKCKKYEKIER